MKDNTEFNKRKRDMMELWKLTFHDSDDYIKLVFDTYFSLDNSFVRYEDNRLISALLGVSYKFQAYDKKNNKKEIKGFYLCGLATHPDWRRKGIMSQLMEEAEKSAKTRGYDITFLIPADDHLREYYRQKGYQTSSYRQRQVIEKTEGSNKATNPKMYIYTIKDFLSNGKKSFVEQIAEWCCEIEINRRGVISLQHSKQDMFTAMVENENSFFLTDSSIDLEYPILANVAAVGFPELPKNTNEPMRIVGWYSTKEKSNSQEQSKQREQEMKINERQLSFLLSEIINPSIELLLPYTGESMAASGVEPYAMIKPLNKDTDLPNLANQKIEISLMLD